jgi:hypothetical protein
MIENLRKRGQILFFEYHCWESHASADAELWYRSHQRVKVLGLAPNDGYYPKDKVLPIHSFADRCEAGCPICYKVKFTDGHIGDVFEDELLDSPKEYQRPNPPKRRDVQTTPCKSIN